MTLHPLSHTQPSDFYRCLKRRLEFSLGRSHGKRDLKYVKRPLFEQDCTHSKLATEVFQLICTRWHQSQIDIFRNEVANNKLPQFVSPVLDSLAWTIDALSLP